MERNTHTIDLTDKKLGRVATEVATLLSGKRKVSYQPHLDCGDFVVIKHLDKLNISQKKMNQKEYRHHTGYIGHVKLTKLKELWQKNPEQVFIKAVYNMLPANKLRKNMMKRLSFEK